GIIPEDRRGPAAAIIAVPMLGRTATSAALAASILAADLVLLTLFLNPGVGLRHDGTSLFLVLFVPYAAAGALALLLVALAGTALRGSSLRRSTIEGLPWFTTLAFVTLAGSAVLFWTNLLSYRYSIPIVCVRALAGAAIAISASVLVVFAVGVD